MANKTSTKNKVIAEAEKHIGKKGKDFWDAYGLVGDWCCMFVWYCFNKAGLKKKFYNGGKTASVDEAYTWAKSKLTKISYGKEKEGDLIFFDWNSNNSPDHIGLIQKKGYSIEGNSGDEDYTKSKVVNRKISNVKSDIFAIYRPNYTDSDTTTVTDNGDGTTTVQTRKSYTFLQYKGDWANKPYPGGADDMASSGCGPTSIANILANSISPKITPLDVWQYMNNKGYGIPNAGSTWAGMTDTINHFGLKCKHIGYPTGQQIFDLMDKGSHFIIFVFGGGTQGGVTWTLGGHYVAATGYKIEKNKHYFYTRDSGGRDNNGWHCYEDTMSSLVAGVWYCGYSNKSQKVYLVDNINKGDSTSAGGYTGQTTYVDTGAGIVLNVNKLQSSDNYSFITQTKKEEQQEQSATSRYVQSVKDLLNNKVNKPLTENSANAVIEAGGVIPRTTITTIIEDLLKTAPVLTKSEPKKIEKGTLLSYPSFVEAPVIVLNLNGVVIGGYGNFGDIYPNYIDSMTIDKTSGKINQYTINLTYQVRFGEDPNFIDKLLSRTGFTNKIQILYGDANSDLYRDDEALVTDVTFNEDVASKQIHYTITAISSIVSVASVKTNFPAKTDKPSTLIHDLLYSKTSVIGKALQDALPGMRNEALVDSMGLIPTTDDTVITQALVGASPVAALNYYVSGMTNENNSIFTLTYHDDTKNELGGAYFKITEIGNTSTDTLNGNYYEVDVGYPGDNFVTNFSVDNNVYFPMIYKYNDKLPKYTYEITDSGDIVKTVSNPLLMNNNLDRINVVQAQWWKRVTEYPITASITIKGLLRPVMLASYLKVNVLFYGREDMASGLYTIIGQRDSISGNGYTTTLSLLRVGNR